MKLSIVTTITNPEERQDPWREALACYADLADEVIVVDGSLGGIRPVEQSQFVLQDLNQPLKIKYLNLYWPDDWGWQELPNHYNAGLFAATGDWVINLDIDRFIHEDDFKRVRDHLQALKDVPVASFQKMSVYAKRRYMQKGELLMAINKGEYGNAVGFGRDKHKYTDLCEPIFFDGGYDDKDVPIGSLVPLNRIGRTGINIWNFDYSFKSQEVAVREFLKMSLAFEKYFGSTKWGRNEQEALIALQKLLRGRMDQCNYEITDPNILPKYIRDSYMNLLPWQFAYDGWGLYAET